MSCPASVEASGVGGGFGSLGEKFYVRLIGWVGMTTMAIAVVIALGLLLRFKLAEPVGIVDAEVQIQSGASRIVNYNHFFDLCAAVQTNEAALDAQFDALDAAESASERSRIRTNISGLKAARYGNITQYNVDASKDYTIGQFRDADLPYQLPATRYDSKGENPTSCDG